MKKIILIITIFVCNLVAIDEVLQKYKKMDRYRKRRGLHFRTITNSF